MATRMLNLIAKRVSALKIARGIPSSTSAFLVSPSYAAASRFGHLFDHRPWRSEPIGSNPLFPAVLMVGALGFGSVGISLADAGEEDCQASAASEDIVLRERQRLEELLRSKGMQPGSYPPFVAAVKGQKVTVKFKVPPTCDLSLLIANLVSHLGLKPEGVGGGSEMLMRAWNSAASWQLTLRPPVGKNDVQGTVSEAMEKQDNFFIFIFESLVGPEYCEIEFIKDGSFNFEELDALSNALKLAGASEGIEKSPRKNQRGNSSRRGTSFDASQRSALEKSVSALEGMGVRVYGYDEPHEYPKNGVISWDNIAGYDQQKQEIEDTILLALQCPEVYDNIAQGTRSKFESNRPRAVLFEGPPGTGKTSSARVIAKEAGVPLLYVPLEVIMSKYYGESERLLGTVFSLANELATGAIVFLDEVDSFAVARDDEMHEATRRLLSVILRQIDGFEQDKNVVVIAATNRKNDLDPALISRFDSMITFDLPDQQTREEILAQYAKHLARSDLVKIALATENMSGRDIKDICQQAERHWAAKLIRSQVPKDTENTSLPPMEEYIRSADQRQKALSDILRKNNAPRSNWRPAALA
ncbi:putative AAA+ ATPase domain, ATPase, AAA-type, core [Dioscorea sansibarensis]